MFAAQHYTPIKTRLLLAKTLIIPILTYGCEIFSSCSYQSKRKLTVAFNNTARYIFGLRRYDHISEISNHILNMSFENMLNFRTLTLLADILLSQTPRYLFDRIRRTSSVRSLQLINPRYSSLTSERQFYVNSIRLWNALPRSIREIRDAVKAKLEIKKYLSRS